jgi:hypothetical protein
MVLGKKIYWVRSISSEFSLFFYQLNQFYLLRYLSFPDLEVGIGQ